MCGGGEVSESGCYRKETLMYSGCGVGLTDTQTLVFSWQVGEESESHLSIRGYEACPAVSCCEEPGRSWEEVPGGHA